MFNFKIHAFLFLLVLCFFSINAITKNDLVKQAEKHSVPLKISISANFSSKISIQNSTVSDSGVYYFSPPNRTRIDFNASKMIFCSVGDTTWSKSPTSDVTRSTKLGLGLPGNQGGTPSMSTPNLLSYLKSGDFSIVGEDSAAIVVKTDITYDKQKVPFTFYIDSKAFVIKRIEFPSPMGGMFQIGYKYKLFEGHLVLDEVNTVMGSMGFTRVQLFNYQSSKKNRSFFRLF